MPNDVNASATTMDQPPMLDDRSFFGHPKGLMLLFFVEMWERFSYYGMRGLLTLYLVDQTTGFGWSDDRAFTLYGNYTSLAYLTPLIGGYLADRWLGTSRSLVIGGVIIALGHFALAVETLPFFYTGLGLVIVGTGFFKPNVSTMVGQLYREGDPRRDSGFTIFYMGINLGAFLAGIVCGWLAQQYGWPYGFGAAGVGMTAGLLLYVWGKEKYLPGIGLTPREEGKRSPPDAGSMLASASSGSKPLLHGAIGGAVGLIIALATSGGSPLGLLMGTTIGASLAVALLGTRGDERNRVIAIFIVVFFVVFFWMAFEQAGSSMNIFAERHTDRMIGGFEVPAPWFQSVNAFFIMAFAAVFAWLWSALGRRGREPSTALKMAMGLFLLGIGFLFMVIGARGADAGMLVSPMWLVMAYLFHTWGELCLSPVGLSYVTKVAPIRFASLLMGVWFLANSAANKLAGWLATFTTDLTLTNFYQIPVWTSIGAGAVLLVLVPLLKRLTRTVKA